MAQNLSRHRPADELWDKIENRLISEMSKPGAVPSKKAWYEKAIGFRNWIKIADSGWSGLRIGLAAAATIILIMLSTFLIYHQQNHPAKGPTLAQLDKEIRQTEQHYQKLILQLSKLAQENEKNLDPHLLALYREKLTLLDESIRTCQRALEENYNNPAIQVALFDSYREKVATLRMMVHTKPLNQSEEVS